MAHREPSPAAHDRLLVIGVAGLMLGVVLVCQGMPLAEPTAHLTPHAHATLTPAERDGSAPGVRLATPTSPPDRAPSTPTTRTASSGTTGLLAPCAPYFDLGHDLGQDLAAMAQQGRRVNHECPAGHLVAPANQDVPPEYRALARAEGSSVTRAQASPQAARLPMVPGG
jgi:hypothetical protein